jgi:hypothetical protein
MENFSWEYLGLAVLGLFIHILMKIASRTNKNTNKVSISSFFKDSMNWVRILLSLSSIVALLMMAADLSDMLGVTLKDGSPARSVFAFGAGYLNHSLIFNVLKVFKKGNTGE